MILQGESQAKTVKIKIENKINKNNLAKIDYIVIVNAESLDSVALIKGSFLVLWLYNMEKGDYYLT